MNLPMKCSVNCEAGNSPRNVGPALRPLFIGACALRLSRGTPPRIVSVRVVSVESQQKRFRRFERRRLQCPRRATDRLRRAQRHFAPMRGLLGLRPLYLTARGNRSLGTPQEFQLRESAANCRASGATAARLTSPWIRNLLGRLKSVWNRQNAERPAPCFHLRAPRL